MGLLEAPWELGDGAAGRTWMDVSLSGDSSGLGFTRVICDDDSKSTRSEQPGEVPGGLQLCLPLWVSAPLPQWKQHCWQWELFLACSTGPGEPASQRQHPSPLALTCVNTHTVNGTVQALG